MNLIRQLKIQIKLAMSLSDLFCVERHKPHFLNLVKNKLDITFANEQEITSLIDAKNFEDVNSFAKQINKIGFYSNSIENPLQDKVTECDSKKDLKVVDLTGAGDLFAAGFLHGSINNLTISESLEKGTEMSSKIIQKIGARLN